MKVNGLLIRSAVIAALGGLLFGFDTAIIDHFGRKRLMLVGSVGYILSLGAAAWAFQAYQAEFQGVTEASQAVAVARAQFHEAAQAAGAHTPLGAQATQIYALMELAGQADLDFSGVIKLLRGEV